MTKLDWAKANRAEMPKAAKPKTNTQKKQEAVAKAYTNGSIREQERIIKLAEKHEPIWDRDGFVACLCGNESSWLNHFQELIKGETK